MIKIASTKLVAFAAVLSTGISNGASPNHVLDRQGHNPHGVKRALGSEEDPDNGAVAEALLDISADDTTLQGLYGVTSLEITDVFGEEVEEDPFDDTAIATIDGKHPTINIFATKLFFSMIITQPSTIDKSHDNHPFTLNGTVFNVRNGIPTSAWKFLLKFTFEVKGENDPFRTNKYTLSVQGWLRHITDPHAVDDPFGKTLRVVARWRYRETDGAGEKDGQYGPLIEKQHPKGGHVDRLEKNLLTGTCCDGLEGWKYELIAQHSQWPMGLPSVFGDPHFRTWGGFNYDYHGECDMVFLSAPNFVHGLLDIHIRSKIRYDYSFIASAAVRIGDDVLEVSGWGDYIFNGVNDADLSKATSSALLLNHTEVDVKHHIFEIIVDDKERIQLSTFKDWVSITIIGASTKNFDGSIGLLGEYSTGDMLARDGSTIIEDPNTFGQEWQVLPSEPQLFTASRSPQSPDICILPDPTAKESRRRLGETIERSAAEEACLKGHFDKTDIENCIFDVMASGDLEMAQAGVITP